MSTDPRQWWMVPPGTPIASPSGWSFRLSADRCGTRRTSVAATYLVHAASVSGFGSAANAGDADAVASAAATPAALRANTQRSETRKLAMLNAVTANTL